jgi:hypothetical protein
MPISFQGLSDMTSLEDEPSSMLLYVVRFPSNFQITKLHSNMLISQFNLSFGFFFSFQGPKNRSLLDEPLEDHGHLFCLYWKPTFLIRQFFSMFVLPSDLGIGLFRTGISTGITCHLHPRAAKKAPLVRDEQKQKFLLRKAGNCGMSWSSPFRFHLLTIRAFPGPVTSSIDSFVLPAFPFFNRLNSGLGAWSTDHCGILNMGQPWYKGILKLG